MKTVVTIICFFVLSFARAGVLLAEKFVIGETAWIEVGGVPFNYLARIDTGASTTSIHAIDVKVADASVNPDENLGKMVTFRTLNRNGKSGVLTLPIVKVSTIINTQGTEQRYIVRLPIAGGGVRKEVKINLRDRSKMTYKLLIGRNWLSKDFLVDVDMKADENGGGK